jgi:hypothetical protein
MPWISFLIFHVVVSTTMIPLAAGEDRTGADRDSHEQERRAQCAPPEILQREARKQEPDARRSGRFCRPQGCLQGEIGHGVKLRPARRALQRARARMLHVLELGGDDHAVVVPAAARQNADQLVGRRVDAGEGCRTDR